MSFGASRLAVFFLLLFFSSLADVEFNNLEILNVGNESILILVDTLEDVFTSILGTFNSQKFIGVVDESVELFEVHFSFRSSGHLSSSMFSLETHLSTVSLEQEIAEFLEVNSPVAINVKSEDVLHDVINLILRLFMEDINDNLFDCFYLNSVVFLVLVKDLL